jgi:hypothetical protein
VDENETRLMLTPAAAFEIVETEVRRKGAGTLKSNGEQRPHWGRRALVLALVGGLVGWIVAYVLFLVLLQAIVRMQAPSTLDQVVDAVGKNPQLGSALVLGALASGVPCGAALGLVIWSVWFLVSRRARVPNSDSSPYP